MTTDQEKWERFNAALAALAEEALKALEELVQEMAKILKQLELPEQVHPWTKVKYPRQPLKPCPRYKRPVVWQKVGYKRYRWAHYA